MTCPAGTTPCPTPRNNSSLYWIVCQEKNAPGFKVPFIHGTGLPVQRRRLAVVASLRLLTLGICLSLKHTLEHGQRKNCATGFEIRDQKADTRIPRSPGTHTHGLIHVDPLACPVGSSRGRPFISNLIIPDPTSEWRDPSAMAKGGGTRQVLDLSGSGPALPCFRRDDRCEKNSLLWRAKGAGTDTWSQKSS